MDKVFTHAHTPPSSCSSPPRSVSRSPGVLWGLLSPPRQTRIKVTTRPDNKTQPMLASQSVCRPVSMVLWSSVGRAWRLQSQDCWFWIKVSAKWHHFSKNTRGHVFWNLYHGCDVVNDFIQRVTSIKKQDYFPNHTFFYKTWCYIHKHRLSSAILCAHWSLVLLVLTAM